MVAGKTKIQGGQWYKQWEPQIDNPATIMLMKCKMTHSRKTIANIPSKHCQSGNAIKWCQPIKHLSCSCQLHGHLPFSHGVLHLKLSAQLKEWHRLLKHWCTFNTYNCPMLMTWFYDVVPWGKSQKQNAKPKGMQAVVFFFLPHVYPELGTMMHSNMHLPFLPQILKKHMLHFMTMRKLFEFTKIWSYQINPAPLPSIWKKNLTHWSKEDTV